MSVSCLADGPDSRRLKFVLVEGRNRQIRKMVAALGLEVVALHRTHFAGISLKGLSANNWAELTAQEMSTLCAAYSQCAHLTLGIIQAAISSTLKSTSQKSEGTEEDDFD